MKQTVHETEMWNIAELTKNIETEERKIWNLILLKMKNALKMYYQISGWDRSDRKYQKTSSEEHSETHATKNSYCILL